MSGGHRPATPLSTRGAFLTGLVAAAAAPMLAWTLDPLTVEVGGLLLGALAAGAIGALSTTTGAAAAAAVCWAADDGFTLNRLGELHAAAADLRAFEYILGVALLCRASAAALRAARAFVRSGTGDSVALPAVLIADLARRAGLRPTTGTRR